MSGLRVFGGTCCALLLLTNACSDQSSDRASEQQAGQLAVEEVRTATAQFASLDAATEVGYPREVENCLVHEHHGAMGYHHVNAGYMDDTLDIGKPEILLYERLPSGEYVLNGVEYIIPYRYWPRDSVPPRMFDEPMRHEENLEFWYLHVWAWKPNPDGPFADFHPDVQCPAGASRVFRPNNG